MAGSVAADAPRRGGWYYGWTIVGLGMLSQMAGLGLALSSFTFFLQDWHREFGTPLSTLELSVTVFSLVCAVFCALAGMAADKLPARWLLAGGVALLAVLHVAVGFATAGWQIIVIFGVMGVGVTFSSNIPCQALVSRWFVRQRGMALGISALGINAAAVVLPPVVIWSVHSFGWRQTWEIYAGAMAVLVLPALVFGVRDRPRPGEGAAYLGAEADAPAAAAVSLKDILTRPNFWIVGAAFLCVYCASMGVGLNLGPLVKSRGLSDTTLAILASSLGAADVVGKLGSGWLADRFGNRLPLTLMCLIGAAGAALIGATQGMAALVIGLLLVGATGAIWTLLASATATEFGQAGFGRAFGVICTFTPFGSLAPPVVAWAKEQTSSFSVGLYGLAGLALVGALLSLLLKERRARPAGA